MKTYGSASSFGRSHSTSCARNKGRSGSGSLRTELVFCPQSTRDYLPVPALAPVAALKKVSVAPMISYLEIYLHAQ